MGEREVEAVREVFDTGWLGMGSCVFDFEERLKDFLHAENIVCTNSGTNALHLSLASLGIGPGDEVLVPSFTFVSTVQVISETGARPVFCDVNPEDLNIDVEDAGSRINDRTKAIMPVHYRGIPCDMDEILALAGSHDIKVVEDAAHAFGSSYRDKKIGSFGDITCFSFDPIKNITCGEGGAVVFTDKSLLNLMQQKRILGIDKDTWSRYRNERSWFYDVVTQGYRYHMSNINAAIGLVQLDKFADMNRRKCEVAQKYDRAFGDLPGVSLLRNEGYQNIGLFIYTLKIEEQRDKLMEMLAEEGVGSGINYIPSHLFSFYQDPRRSLPVTEEAYRQIISLPLFPDITDAEVERVINAMEMCTSRLGRG